MMLTTTESDLAKDEA